MIETFGPYRLLRLLGRGGMGEVYRALDTRRNREVALKRLMPGLAANPTFTARFQAEARIVSRLHEPHIIPIHDFGEIDGQLFIDMRLVEGSDLAELVAREGPLTPRRAVAVVGQIAAALDAAHRAGLVHRDIKPGNALVVPGPPGTEDGDFVYVADFGIARSTDTGGSLTATGAMVGSPQYMAPERFVHGHGDLRVDVYALGCLLHEALTGAPPFPVEGLPALINAHLNTPPPRPSGRVHGMPPGLDAVVARALATNPADRVPSAGALAAAARAAVDGAARRPAPAIPSPAGPADPPWPDEPAPETAPIGWPAVPRGEPSRPDGPGPAGAAASGSPPSTMLAARSRPAPPGPTRLQDPPPPVSPRTGRRVAVLLAVVALLVAGGVAAVRLVPSGASTPPPTPPAQPAAPDPNRVRAEPVGLAGDDPFMPAVGDDLSGVVAAPGSGGTAVGGTEGLYGGTRRTGSCDAAAVVAFLAAHPDQGRAWAQVQGIAPEQVPAFVAGLTPVVLRTDVAVTNHGFANGSATVVPAVLQAGTAVLVDARGVPRVRCACGNPLTEPTPVAAPRYTGGTWPGLQPGAVTTVTAAPAPLARFTLVDPLTGAAFDRPVGTAGASDVARTTQRVPLFQVPVTSDAPGASGGPADPALTGVPGTNTSFWVGCAGTPATTNFALGGGYVGVTGTLRLAAFAPPDLVVEVRLLADGQQVHAATLGAGVGSAFDVDVGTAQELVLTAQAVQGTCTVAPVGYGVLVDAVATR